MAARAALASALDRKPIKLNGYPLHSRSLKGWGWIVGGNDLMERCRPAGDGLLDEAMEEQSVGLGAPAVEAEGEFGEVYPVHVTTRKSFGLMTRKLSVTESHRSAQFRETFSRKKPSVASANWAQVA